MTMFERFTDRARRAIVLAQDEARRLNHSYIGTEHLLLSLIRESEGTAAKTLVSLGIPLDSLREQIERTISVSQQSPTGHLPFTPRAKKVLELALREALNFNHAYIGTAHILLGLIREGEGVAAKTLIELGVDLASVRELVRPLVIPPPTSAARGVPFILDTVNLGGLDLETCRKLAERLRAIQEILDLRIQQLTVSADVD